MAKFVKIGGLQSQPIGTTGGAVTGIPNHGVSTVTATSNELYVLEPPEAGVRKTLVFTSSTSAAGPTIMGSTGVTVTFNKVGATQIVGGATTDDQIIELLGASTTRWYITSMFPVASSGAGPNAGTT